MIIYLLLGCAFLFFLWSRPGFFETMNDYPPYAVVIACLLFVLFWPAFLLVGIFR